MKVLVAGFALAAAIERFAQVGIQAEVATVEQAEAASKVCPCSSMPLPIKMLDASCGTRYSHVADRKERRARERAIRKANRKNL